MSFFRPEKPDKTSEPAPKKKKVAGYSFGSFSNW
jgi:hypothetical protein